MAKVYSAVPGPELRIDTYGTATETDPVDVPEAVAERLREDSRLRVETDTPAPRLGRKAGPAPLKKEG